MEINGNEKKLVKFNENEGNSKKINESQRKSLKSIEIIENH